MTEHEKEALKRKAAKNGMTVSEYARMLLANSDDATIRVIDAEPLRKAAHELAKQGTNLNQFMRFLNTYGSNALDHEEAKAVLGKEVVMVRVRLEGLPDEVQRIADAMQAAGCVLERSREYPNRGESRYVRVYLDCDLPKEVSRHD